jgi:glutaredoxin
LTGTDGTVVEKPRVRTYTQPGCSSCAMVKAFLTRHGIEFDDFNPAIDPAAMDELSARGIMKAPSVIYGDKWVSGWNPTKLAELVGITHEEKPVPADELIRTIGLVHDAALRATRQVPDDAWETTRPPRPRPVRELVRHIFQIIEKSVDADVLGEFPALTWLPEYDVPFTTGRDRLERYGVAVGQKFHTWYETIDDAAMSRIIDADVGPRTLNQVLERTRLHSGQHLRQLYAFLELSGVAPEAPFTEAEMRRLGFTQLPDEVF